MSRKAHYWRFYDITQIQSSLVLQANNMYIDKPGAVNHVWLELLNAMLNSVIILLAIPIMDQLIFPFLRDFTPSTLKRIGMGWVSLVLASFISMLHEAVSYHQSRSNDRCVFSLNDGVGADSPSLPFWLYLLTQTLLSVSYMLIKTSSKLTLLVCLNVCLPVRETIICNHRM